MLSEHIAKVLFRASKSKEEVHSDVGRECGAASQSLTKPHQGEKKRPHPRPLSEWNNPTQPPPRGGVPNGSQLGNAYFNSKGAFLRCEETPFSLQGNALFKAKKASLCFCSFTLCKRNSASLHTARPSFVKENTHTNIDKKAHYKEKRSPFIDVYIMLFTNNKVFIFFIINTPLFFTSTLP